MTSEDTTIRDLSGEPVREWIPPISVLGGPPAHELYHDLVVFAHMRLYRSLSGEAWVALQDGEHRRMFRVPSSDLISALDRFRLKRNLRPVPDKDLEEFSRIIRARISDPDTRFPLIAPEEVDTEPSAPPSGPFPYVPETPRTPREVPAIGTEPNPQGPPLSPFPGLPETPPFAGGVAETEADHPLSTPGILAHLSGGILTAESEDESLPRYIKALQDLVRNGDWIGSISDLSKHVGDDPDTAFDNLLRLRPALATTGIVVAPVQMEDGWRWLAVDRNRIHTLGPRDPA